IGSIYFLLIAIAHAVGLKIPGLFLYYNVPSYVYQNKIISLLAFGWSAFFFTTASHPAKRSIKTIIFIGAVAVGMLTFININTNFLILSETIHPTLFHIETGILFIYWLWLVFCYIKIKRNLETG
ncbi:MAG: hypothetical protein MUP98_09900, partial [Candidatus Aminicenantes bacterium]|nr:hypothetical protein [Candidatus Aminicenantes bacterium]